MNKLRRISLIIEDKGFANKTDIFIDFNALYSGFPTFAFTLHKYCAIKMLDKMGFLFLQAVKIPLFKTRYDYIKDKSQNKNQEKNEPAVIKK